MSCAPDPEPCERCGAPIMVTMLNGRPVGWHEYQCLCLAADHHFGYPCKQATPHTPERCAAWRGRPDATAWQDMRHTCLVDHPARRMDPRFMTFEQYEEAQRRRGYVPPRDIDLGKLAREIDERPEEIGPIWETE